MKLVYFIVFCQAYRIHAKLSESQRPNWNLKLGSFGFIPIFQITWGHNMGTFNIFTMVIIIIILPVVNMKPGRFPFFFFFGLILFFFSFNRRKFPLKVFPGAPPESELLPFTQCLETSNTIIGSHVSNEKCQGIRRKNI